MAFSQVIIVNVFLLRADWQTNDSMQIFIQQDSSFLRPPVVVDWDTSISGSDPTYLKSCENTTASSLVGRQHSLIIKGTSQGNVTVLFQPNFSNSQARYGISDFRLLSGCNNFMLSNSPGQYCNECMPGYYYNPDKFSCEKCNANCKTCSNGSEMSCLSCPAYSLPVNKTCKFSASFHIVNDTEVDEGKAVNVSSCGTLNMLGGPLYGNTNMSLTRKFTLPRHSYVKIQVNMVRIGEWPLGFKLFVMVNGK